MSRLRGRRLTFTTRLQTALSLVAVLGLLLGTVTGIAAQDDKPTVTVGSKQFTEQLILGELLAQLLEDAGYPVERQIGLAGTDIVHQALVNDEVDTYVEYTGTGLLAILNMSLPAGTPTAGAAATPVAGADAVYDIVKDEYAQAVQCCVARSPGFQQHLHAGFNAGEGGRTRRRDDLRSDCGFRRSHLRRDSGVPDQT